MKKYFSTIDGFLYLCNIVEIPSLKTDGENEIEVVNFTGDDKEIKHVLENKSITKVAGLILWADEVKKVEVIDMPREEEIQLPADVLKVIEFYAR